MAVLEGTTVTTGNTTQSASSKSESQRERVGDRVTIYKVAGSPNWYLNYSDGNAPFRRSLGTSSKKRAIALARKKDAELVLGIAEQPAKREIGIQEATDEYLKSLELRGRGPGTLDNYRRDLKQFAAFAKSVSVVRLASVTAELLERYQDRLQTTGLRGIVRQQKLGRRLVPNLPKTVRNKLKTLRQLLKWALRRKLLREDPGSGYQLPPEPKGKAYIWTPQEHTLIRKSAEQPWLDIFDFLAMTGLRSDELCWLLKDDVCLGSHPHLFVRAKKCPQTGMLWHPKHSRNRVVPLCPNAADIARRAYSTSPGPWLFWASGSRGPQVGHCKRDAVWRALRRTLQKAEVNRGTVHTFRHVFCSFAANHNVPPFQVMTILGHGSLEIVLRYYHLGQDELLHSLDGLPFGQMQCIDGDHDAI
jgi:site-specific recombinase XerD